MRWICREIEQTIPSDTVHERIEDYELLSIANSSFSDILQTALNFAGKSSAGATPSWLAVNYRFIKLGALLNGIFWWSILHIVHDHSVIENSVNNPVFLSPAITNFPHETQPICLRFSC